MCFIVQNTGGKVVAKSAIELEAEDKNEELFNAAIKTSLFVDDPEH